MVEHQLQTWYGRVLKGTFAKLANARTALEPPGEDKEIGWYCRITRGLNDWLNVDRSIRSPWTEFQWPQLTWGERIGLPECPYMRRWVLDFGAFALRLHHWYASDDVRAFHDHTWWFWTLILCGAYVDVSPAGRDHLSPGSVRFRAAEHQHTVEILRRVTSVLITGPVVRRWGFWVNGKLIKRDKYFATCGHHPCEPGQPPVRRRPDGSRIY